MQIFESSNKNTISITTLNYGGPLAGTLAYQFFLKSIDLKVSNLTALFRVLNAMSEQWTSGEVCWIISLSSEVAANCSRVSERWTSGGCVWLRGEVAKCWVSQYYGSCEVVVNELWTSCKITDKIIDNRRFEVDRPELASGDPLSRVYIAITFVAEEVLPVSIHISRGFSMAFLWQMNNNKATVLQ